MTAPTRLYRCTTVRCAQVGAELEVTATAVGPFWTWPPLVCECGTEPRVVNHPSWPLPISTWTG